MGIEAWVDEGVEGLGVWQVPGCRVLSFVSGKGHEKQTVAWARGTVRACSSQVFISAATAGSEVGSGAKRAARSVGVPLLARA